ncbi:uncharacterized protein LOC119683852 [Teleopsis dalmanni]|uniref:uncharacterized protein LOC119683852 n=1 Tax=Teleopsis dalmanni TaxID=139649 RepID=UPI0018CCE8C7|nr:uncharacterized protein LOC119683852 [Teleopsis dalmanni]
MEEYDWDSPQPNFKNEFKYICNTFSAIWNYCLKSTIMYLKSTPLFQAYKTFEEFIICKWEGRLPESPKPEVTKKLKKAQLPKEKNESSLLSLLSQRRNSDPTCLGLYLKLFDKNDTLLSEFQKELLLKANVYKPEFSSQPKSSNRISNKLRT